MTKRRNRPQRTECLRGHPLTGGNVYTDPTGNRACRECRKNRKRKPGGVEPDSDAVLDDLVALESAPEWVKQDPAERRKWVDRNRENPLHMR